MAGPKSEATVGVSILSKPEPSRIWSRNWWTESLEPLTLATLLLVVGTLVTIPVSVWSTNRSIKSASEDSVLPLLVLDTVDTAGPTRLAVHNVGLGPALNARSVAEAVDSETMCLEHKEAIGKGDGTNLVVIVPGRKSFTSDQELAGELTSEGSSRKDNRSDRLVYLEYQNEKGESFATLERVWAPSVNVLAINFLCSRPIAKEQELTPGTACKDKRIPAGFVCP